MNKHLYRIVFNRSLGLLQVACELARAAIGGSADGRGRILATVRPLGFALWLGLGWVAPGWAQVVADPRAPKDQRPTVLRTRDGVPQVDIRTPSARGVSRNRYSRFDVGPDGAILNNARAGAATHLGGSVPGNPWLATGTARIILNEVDASDPSRLHGYVEVAGDRAEVVIANPAGIGCDGCGFINASRATLTTGTLQVDAEGLRGYRVAGGAIRIEGAGMDGRDADYTGLIARSVEVNAGLWAQRLEVVSGLNQVDAHSSGAEALESGARGAAPLFGLDVGALGGMYAGQITLVGTEQGVGVRNAGEIGAQAGDLVVTTDGRLENSGAMQSRQDVRVAAGGVGNAGTLSAEGTLRLDAGAGLDNAAGTLSAQRLEVSAATLDNRGGTIAQTGEQGLELSAGTLRNGQGGRIGIVAAAPQEHAPGDGGGTDAPEGAEGGPVPEPPSAAPGFLRIAGRVDNAGGGIQASGGIGLEVDRGLDNAGGHIGVERLALSAGVLDNAGGELRVAGDVDLALERVDNAHGHLEAGGALGLDVGALDNRGGTLVQRGTDASTLRTAGAFDNTDGIVYTRASALELHSDHLINARGRIEHAGSDGLVLRTGRLDGQDGAVLASGALSLEAGAVDHRGATLAGGDLRVRARSFDNGGGTVAGLGALSIHADVLGNVDGTVQQAGEGGLSIHADRLDGAGGLLASDGALLLSARTADLAGGIAQAETVVADTDVLVTAGGALIATGDDALVLSARERLDNTGGRIAGNGALQLEAGALGNRNGQIVAVGTAPSRVQVAGALDNHRGLLVAGGATTLQAASLDNAGGTVQAGGALRIEVAGRVDTGRAGRIAAEGGLSVEAEAVIATAGTIVNAGHGDLILRTGQLDGADGTLASAGAFELDTGTAYLRGADVSAQRIAIDADSLTTAYGRLVATGHEMLRLNVRQGLDNAHGFIAGNGALGLSAGWLDNHRGLLSAAGTGASRLSVGGLLDNSRGTLRLGGSAEVDADTLDNRNGTVHAQGSLTVDAGGLLDNSERGLLASGGTMRLTANVLVNTGGTLRHFGRGSLVLRAATLESAGGTILSNGALALDGQTVDLRRATTQAHSIAIDSGTLLNTGGTLSATGRGRMVLNARDRIDNTDGRIESNGSLQVDTAALDNAGGALAAVGSGASAVTVSGLLDNTGGVLETGGDTAVHAGELVNAGGRLRAAGTGALRLAVDGRIDNAAGRIGAGGDLDLSAIALDNSGGAIEHTGQGAAAIVVDALHGAGGRIASNGALELRGDVLDLRAGETFAAQLTIEGGTVTTAQGVLSATGPQGLAIVARVLLDNASGRIASNGAFQLQAPVLDNRGGTITAAGTDASAIETATALDNTGGVIIAAGDTTVHAGDLLNAGGRLQAAGAARLELTAAGLLDNAYGSIAAGGDLSLEARRLDNTGGAIEHAGAGRLDIVAEELDGRGGTLASNGALTLQGQRTDLSGGTTVAERIEIDTGTLSNAHGTLLSTGTQALSLTVAGALDNTGGTVAGNGALTLAAGSLDNAGGTLEAAGTGRSRVEVAGALDNAAGRIAVAGAADVRARDLDNRGGVLLAAGDLQVDTVGRLDNAAGTLQAGGALALAAGTLDNAGGAVRSEGDLSLAVAVLNGAGGELITGGALSLEGERTDLTGTTVVAERIALDTDTLLLAGGTLASTGSQGMVLTARTALDNRHGYIASGGGLQLQAGRVDNAGGRIDANGPLQMQAAGFDNRDGLLQQGGTGALDLTVSDALDNASGLIGTTGSASVRAGSLDNSGGTLVARDGLSLTTTGALRNSDGGLLQGDAALALQAGGLLDNSGGVLDTRGTATVEAADIDNLDGRILAGTEDEAADATTLTLTASGQVDNRGGVIGSRAGDVAVSAGGLDNGADGQVVAPRDLHLDVGMLDNTGTVYAARDLHYIAAAGALDNRGRFGAGENAWIEVGRLRNGADAVLQAMNMELSAGALELAGGRVAADVLRMHLGALSGAGHLYGAQQLDLDIAGDLTYGAGQVLESDGVLGLTVGGTLTNLGTVQSATALLLDVGGLVNQGILRSGNADGSGLLGIQAGSVDNRAGARLEGDTVLIDAASVTNTGDIVGHRLLIEAGSLTNGRDLGTADAARDYGEGFIGAADYLDLRVGRLSNLDAELYSGGDLVVAGRTSGARATRVDNVSGRIQAEGGLHLAASTLDTRRRVVEYVNRPLSPEEQTAGRRDIPAAEHAFYDRAYQREYDLYCTRGCNLDISDYREWAFPLNTVAISRTSASAQILSGGGMTLDTGTLYNRASAIAAGGSLLINGSTAGEDAPGVFNESFAGLQTWDVHAAYGVGFQYCQGDIVYEGCVSDSNNPGGGYSSSPGVLGQVSIPYAPEEGRATITAGGGLSIVSGGDVDNTAVVSGGGPDALDPVAVDPAAGPVDFDGPGTVPDGGGGTPGPAPVGPGTVQAETVDSLPSPGAVRTALLHGLALAPLQAGRVEPSNGPDPDAARFPEGVDLSPSAPLPGSGPATDPTVGTPEHPLPGLTPPDNGMYGRDPGPGAAFLVVTDPRFARGPGGGSDYLLDTLNLPADTHKRLGDGYYEQRLVQDQLLQLTGRRGLAGESDGQAQYQALMDGAAAAAAELGLALGAPLTSTQVAALEQDIVWLVEQEVEGERVLVPVVYLSRGTRQRLGSSGGLIASAQQLNVQAAGAVRNDGTLQGSQGAWLGADTLINAGMVHGPQVTVATAGDVLNRGQLAGGAVIVLAGGDYVQGADGRLEATQDAAVQAGGRIALDATEVSAGRNATLIAGQDLDVTGSRVQAGGDLGLGAGRDLTIGRSTVAAGQDLTAHAGHDLNVASAVNEATRQAQASREGKTHLTTVATTQTLDVQVLSAGGNLHLSADHDVNLAAVQLNAGQNLTVSAGNDLNATTLTTVDTSHTLETRKRFKQQTVTRDETVHGTTFEAGGHVVLGADRDINLAGTTALSEEGGIALAAGRDIHLSAVQEQHTYTQTTVKKKKSLLSSKTTTTREAYDDSYAIGTTLSGETVQVAAGHDLSAQGVQIAGTGNVLLAAGHDVNLDTGVNTHEESHSKTVKQSGLFSGGGAGFTIGRRQIDTTADTEQTSHTGSLVGSTEGRVDIVAGHDVTITGSDVLSREGIGIVGQNVTIQAAEAGTSVIERQRFRQAGLNVSLKGGAVDTALAVKGSLERANEVEDDRLAALYVAKAGQTLFSGGAGSGMNSLRGAGDQFSALANTDATTQAQGNNGISLRIGIGASKSDSSMEYTATEAAGSRIASDGEVVVRATGDAQGNGGDLSVIGSRVEGQNVALAAANDLVLKSQRETREQIERNKASSGEIGITIGSEAGIGVYVSAAVAKGKGEGSGLTHAETTVEALDTLTLVSGRDTTLEGAQALGERVVMEVGRDLTLTSQQDSNDYTRKDQSASIDVAVGTGGGSVSGSYNQSKIDSTYTSVKEQTGIQAGSGGYDITVGGHTQLTGAAIASTADPSLNRLETGSLGWSDLKNEAAYSASSVGASFSGGSSGAGFSPSLAVPQHEKATSTTQSAIADGTLIVHDGSGTDIARGATGLQQDGMKEIFDVQKVAERMERGQVAGEVAFRAVGDIAQALAREHTTAELQAKAAEAVLENPSMSEADRAVAQQLLMDAQATMEATQAQYDLWKDGGTGKTLLHAVAGALVAGLGGGDALGGALGAGAAELGRSLTAGESRLVQELVSLGIGAIGGSSGAATGLAGEKFNRQLHPKEIDWINANTEAFAVQEFDCGDGCTPEQLAAAQQRLTIQAMRQVDERWNSILGQGLLAQDGPAQAFLSAHYVTEAKDGFTYFAPGEQYYDSRIFSDDLRSTQALSQLYGAVLKTAVDEGQARRLLQALNRTDAGWRDDFVNDVLNKDAWTAFTMFTGDVGFVADVSRKLLTGDEEGAAQDVMTAILLSRLGVAGGQLVAKLKGPAKEAIGKSVDDLADDAFRKAQGRYGPDGKPLMDFRDLSSDQKRIVGEVLGSDSVKVVVPDGKQLAPLQGTGTNGIDELYAVSRPDVDYIHVEYKFVTDPNKSGVDRLGKTKDGLQGSETWIAGSRRLENALGEEMAGNVRYAMEKGRLESWVVTVRPDGSTQIQVLDAAGNVKNKGASRIIDKNFGERR